MKANAPEKIYLQEPTKVRTEKKYDNDVEYISADAFIEKACEYLMEYEFNDSPTIADRRKRVENFVNYMKESNGMEWISTKTRFPKVGEQVLTACKNKNEEDGIWLYMCFL